MGTSMASLDRLVNALESAVAGSRGLLRALGEDGDKSYSDDDMNPHLRLDYDSTEENHDDSIQIIPPEENGMPKWKKKIVAETERRAAEERKARRRKHVTIRREDVEVARANSDPDKLYPISRDKFPRLLDLIEDLVEDNCEKNRRQLIRFLENEKASIIDKRIKEISIISLDKPDVTAFLENLDKVIEHVDKHLWKHKRLWLGFLTNRDKIKILSRYYKSNQRVDGQDISPLRVKAVDIVRTTRLYVEEEYPNWDPTKFNRRVKIDLEE